MALNTKVSIIARKYLLTAQINYKQENGISLMDNFLYYMTLIKEPSKKTAR